MLQTQKPDINRMQHRQTHTHRDTKPPFKQTHVTNTNANTPRQNISHTQTHTNWFFESLVRCCGMLEPGSSKDKPKPIKPTFPVATWAAVGLRAYLDQSGIPQWIFQRAHQQVVAKSEGGEYLRRNMKALGEMLTEFGVPVSDIGYKKADREYNDMEPWADHTLTSRALVLYLFFQVKHRRNSVAAKNSAMHLLQTIASALFTESSAADYGLPNSVGMTVEDDFGVLNRVSVGFSAQGVTEDWCQLASKNSAVKDVWERLQRETWCGIRITSSLGASTLQDIMFFLFYLLAHPKEALGGQKPFETVLKHVLPEVVLWLGNLMDEQATRLSKQPLVNMPLLKTRDGNHKRKADEVNKFILLDKIKHHKSGRKRIAETHTELAAQHGNLVTREAQMVCAMYIDKVAKEFGSYKVKQFSTSWDPSSYGGLNTLVGTLYSPTTDTVAYMPNQALRKVVFADIHQTYIEEAKASQLGTLEGFSELRALSHALLKSTGCSLMDFRIPQELLARPLMEGEVRVFHNNAWYIVGADGVARPEIPPSLDLATLNALSSCSDHRGQATLQA